MFRAKARGIGGYGRTINAQSWSRRIHERSIPLDTGPSWKNHVDQTVQFILWAAFGSSALHLLNIKQSYAEYKRKSDVKIAILRDVIKRIGNGEKVDVKKELKLGGAGLSASEEAEREWQGMLDDIVSEAERTSR